MAVLTLAGQLCHNVCSPECLQIVWPEPQAKTLDTGLIGGKSLIKAIIPIPGLTTPLFESFKLPQALNIHKLVGMPKQWTYNMYQANKPPLIVTEK